MADSMPPVSRMGLDVPVVGLKPGRAEGQRAEGPGLDVPVVGLKPRIMGRVTRMVL